MVERIYHESDLSQTAIMEEDRLAQAVVSGHSAVEDELPRRLDIDVEEIDLIAGAAIKAVIVEVRRRSDPEAEPERFIVPETAFDKLAKGRKMGEILTEATPVVVEAPKRTRADRSDRNYETLQWAGFPHRGTTSDEEARLVRENLEQINANLAAAGQRPVDPENPQHAARYGFDGGRDTASAQRAPAEPPATA